MAVSLPGRLDPRALLAVLADGEARDEARLARELHTGPDEVARCLDALREAGVELVSAGERGHRLPSAVELLDAGRIRAAIAEPQRIKLQSLEVLFEVDSTNTRLLALEPPARGFVRACLAEIQRAGRGRRGRPWDSPVGGSIALSIGWSLAGSRVDPSMSLAAGVAIARALTRLGAPGIRLKWPNDLWLGDRKMGGVLIELRTEAGGSAHLVIGIGLNISLSAQARRSIEAGGVRVAALADARGDRWSRNELAAAILEEILSMLEEFERSGFRAFREEWLALDALRGRRACVLGGEEPVEGTARGVDEEGALLLDVGNRLLRVAAGEVSLRLSEGAL